MNIFNRVRYPGRRHGSSQSQPCVLVDFFTPEPDRLTGISTYTFQLLEALARRKTLRIVLLTNWRRAAIPPAIKSAGVKIIHVHLPKTSFLLLLYSIFLVFRAARQTNADIVFTPQHIGTILGGKVRICVLHDLYIETHPHFFPRPEKLIWQIAFRVASARSARIVCVSEATCKELLRLHPRQVGKSVVIHEAAAAQAASSGKSQIPTRHPYGLMVAHITPFKNIECVFEALEILRHDGIKPLFYWVGRDEQGLITKAQQRHPQLDNFIPLGRIDSQSLTSLYADADFYVNASLTEGFCIPILEAQTFGIPVICADIDVLKEIGGDGVLTFDPYDPHNLAAHIKQILTDKSLRDALSKRAKANAKRFSWDKAAAETEQLFRQCLDEAEKR